MNIKRGDIIAWTDETWSEQKKMAVPTTVIAIASDCDEFSAALNFHEEGRIWIYDHIPDDAKVRPAETIEAGYLLAKLMEHKYKVVLQNGHVEEFDEDYYEEHPSILTPKQMRSYQFNQYINALIYMYNSKKSLSGMSALRDKHHCTGITKEQFFDLKLNELDALKNYYPQEYTDAIFMYVTGKIKNKPIIKK